MPVTISIASKPGSIMLHRNSRRSLILFKKNKRVLNPDIRCYPRAGSAVFGEETAIKQPKLN